MNANCKVPAWKDRHGNIHLSHDEFVLSELDSIFGDDTDNSEIAKTIIANRAKIVELLKERKPRAPKAVTVTGAPTPLTKQPL